jgi:23S rRNA (adenine2503-C2)-methyltransferase
MKRYPRIAPLDVDRRRIDPLALTCDELAAALQRRCGMGLFHARAVYHALLRQGREDLQVLAQMRAFPRLAAALDRGEIDPCLPPLVARHSEGGLEKLVTRLADGVEVESVLIPMRTHRTVCLSSQAGCRMGCRFCQTGRLGLARNLTASEIVAQAVHARRTAGGPIRNAVFMGMGEPLDNLEAVVQAIRIMADPHGLAIALRYITVSTAGLVDGIERLAALGLPRLNLAVSLNAPNDIIRNALMPINACHPMGALRRALARYPLFPREAILVAYVLMERINDDPHHARELAEYLAPLPVRVNLIPFNPLPGFPFSPPAADRVARFRAELVRRGVFVRLRGSAGQSVMAACGQLGRLPSGDAALLRQRPSPAPGTQQPPEL